jgi:hypothetical protein
MKRQTALIPMAFGGTSQCQATQPICQFANLLFCQFAQCRHATTPMRNTSLTFSMPCRSTQQGKGNGMLNRKETIMNQIIYIVGAIVIIVVLLSFVGLR